MRSNIKGVHRLLEWGRKARKEEEKFHKSVMRRKAIRDAKDNG